MTTPRDKLRAEFETRTILAIPSVPTEFDNVRFEQPKDEMWASGYLMFTASKRASIGSTARFDRHTGFWCVDLYIPEEQGTKDFFEAAYLLEAQFNGTGFDLPDAGHVTCLVAKIVNNPLVKDGFHQKTVMVPFYLDACAP